MIRRRVAIAVASFALIGAACGGDDGGSSEGSTATVAESAADDGEESEAAVESPLQVTSVDYTTGVATLTNTGDQPYDLKGHWICQRPTYAELPDEVLDPGATYEASLGGFDAGGGEVAVYTSNSFSSSEDIVSYVGWGSGGGRQGVAEEAGIWSGGTVQPTGDAITLSGEPGSAGGWSG
jgi:hypothetical protein